MADYTVKTGNIDAGTKSPASARPDLYDNWSAVGKISDAGTASSVVKTDASGNITAAGGGTFGGDISTENATNLFFMNSTGSTSGVALLLSRLGTTQFYFGVAGQADDLVTGSAQNDIVSRSVGTKHLWTSDGTTIDMLLDSSGNLDIAGGYKTGGVSGVSGSFTTTDGKTITITNGIVTSIV